jgi:hypothetical protein
MTLPEAVFSLRRHAQASQRDFCARLGMSLPAFQRYESAPPKTADPRLLVAFLTAAVAHSRRDLARIFERELLSIMDPPRGFTVEIRVKQAKGKRP